VLCVTWIWFLTQRTRWSSQRARWFKTRSHFAHSADSWRALR
jgi:hypothetical protein